MPPKPGLQLHCGIPEGVNKHVAPFKHRLLHIFTGVSHRSPVHCGGQLHFKGACESGEMTAR